MMEVKKQKEETNNWVKVWLIMSYLIILFYMYAYYEGNGKTARQIPLEAHLQHSMTTIIVGYASLLWGLKCVSVSCRFLFLSFAGFRLLALLHRAFAYVFDMVLVTDTPTYSALAFIALIFGVYDYLRRRDSESDRAFEC